MRLDSSVTSILAVQAVLEPVRLRAGGDAQHGREAAGDSTRPRARRAGTASAPMASTSPRAQRPRRPAR